MPPTPRRRAHERSRRSSHPSAESSEATERLARRIEALAPPNAMTPTHAAGLAIYASTQPAHRLHLVYRPSLCVVAQGEKVAHVVDRAFAYDARRFFFTAVPLAAELEVRSAGHPPLLGLVLELEPELVARVALEIDDKANGAAPVDGLARRPPRGTAPAEARGISGIAFTGVLTAALAEALERLVTCASDEIRHHVLYAGTVREVVFELLMGPQGPPLRRALRRAGRLRELIDTARYIDEHYHETLTVPRLARRAGMSESTFFSRFREATGSSPLQYQKRIRLVKARALLATGGRSVGEAALEVGYGSPSQFAREFRATFGCSPSAIAR